MARQRPYRTFPGLRPGDRVAVVAPSSPIREDLLAAGLDEARRLGFEPVTRPDVAARHRFTAGTDLRRHEELDWALRDPSVRAVWLARGGYGVTPLLAGLDPGAFRNDPKALVGESDATALGCWSLCAGVGWLHGPMVAGALRLGAGKGYDEPSLRAALTGEGYPRTEAPVGVRTLRSGAASGVLWGGCLSILTALAGTPWLPRVARGVLVLEDTGAKPYQVHRMLVQLRDCRALDDLAGVVLGDFSDCVQHEDQGYVMDEVFAEFFGSIAPDVPVTIGWPVGHAPAPHLTLPMGTRVHLRVPADGRAELSWDEPPCH